MGKNPSWKRDEVILLMDLYLKFDAKSFSARNPSVIELSEFLNKLPIHERQFRAENFRNPKGIYMKLKNLQYLDPEFEGGLSKFSRLDKIVWEEFFKNQGRLHKIAKSIREIIEDEVLHEKLHHETNEIEDNAIEVPEGTVLYKLHKYRERNTEIVKEKKNQVLKNTGRLDCEVCTL